jgi:hypothetical protein
MSDERGYDQSTGVFAVRLDLISKVHGMEQVLGKRFQIVLGVSRFMVPFWTRTQKVLGKCRGPVQKMRELGFVQARPCNFIAKPLFSDGEA